MIESLPTQPIKLIAIDLDGTLLNTNHEMTERTEKVFPSGLAINTSASPALMT